MDVMVQLGAKLLGLALIAPAFFFLWEAVRILRTPRWEWEEEQRRRKAFHDERAQALRLLNLRRSK